MKLLPVLFLVFIKVSSVFAQHETPYEIVKDSIQNAYLISKLDNMGIDGDSLLNKYEVEYFNAKFAESRGEFDFTDKKTAFFYSPGGSNISTKQVYFQVEKDRFIRGYSSNLSDLIIFDEKERIESGGYDAVIVFWSKIGRSSNFYVKKLKNKNIEKEDNKKEKSLEIKS